MSAQTAAAGAVKIAPCQKFLQKVLVLDLYGRPFMFMLPNHQ